MAEHVDIIDGERHEPKGASTASANQVMKSTGNGATNFAFVNYSEIVGVPVIPTVPVAGAITDLASDADLPTTVAKVNALLGSLRAAGLLGS